MKITTGVSHQLTPQDAHCVTSPAGVWPQATNVEGFGPYSGFLTYITQEPEGVCVCDTNVLESNNHFHKRQIK